MFKNDRVAALCGASSTYFSKVLQSLELDAFTVDYGRQECCLTHVTVVVAQKQNESWKYYVLDPYYNFYLRDSRTGQMPDLFDIIDAVREGRAESITLVDQPLSRRDFIIPQSSGDEFHGVMGQCMTHVGRYDDERNRTRFPGFTFGTFMDHFSRSMIDLPPHCIPSGTPLNQFVTQIETGIYGIGNGRSEESRLQFLTELDRRGIPHGKPSDSIEGIVDQCSQKRTTTAWRCPE